MTNLHVPDQLPHFSTSTNILILIGTVFVLRIVGTVAAAIYKTFLRPGKKLKKLGSWAVVTGATDGIGKAFSFELAKQGLNVLLISRTQERLEEVKKELLAKYPNVTVDTFAADFSSLGAVKQSLITKLKSLEVGVLINNVGISYEHAQYFTELPDDRVQDIVELNINSVITMTRAVLPSMEARNSGAIVNISSASGRFPSPLLSLYSGSKSFVELFSQGLAAEVGPKGVSVQVQSPLFVQTKLAKIRHSSLTVPSASAYARAAVKHIGYETVSCPYWTHAIQLWLLTSLPSFIATWYVRKLHLDIRKRALSKAAKAK